MKILFVDFCIENLGIQALSSFLKRQGHEVSLVQLGNTNMESTVTFSRFKEVLDRIRRDEIDVVGFSVFTDAFQATAGLAKKIREEFPSLPMVCGGIHVTLDPESLMEEGGVDYAVIGEGEEALSELLDHLRTGTPALEKIGNLVYKDASGETVRNALRPLIRDLDSLPLPDKGLYPRSNSLLYVMNTGRGCPRQCLYCSNSAVGKLYRGDKIVRRRSVDHVLSELKLYKKDIRRIFFVDEVFTTSKEWLAEFCRRYKAEIGLPFECQTFPSQLTEENVVMLKDAGLTRIMIGVQTANENLRAKVLTRRYSNAKLIELADILNKHRVEFHVDHMLDLPFETEKDQDDAIALYARMMPTRVTVYFTTVYPNTGLQTLLYENKLIDDAAVERIRKGVYGNNYFFGGGLRGADRRRYRQYVRIAIALNLIPLIRRTLSRKMLEFRLYRFFPPSMNLLRVLFLVNYPKERLVYYLTKLFVVSDRAANRAAAAHP
jgi:radical SAM superfamily enzyme YgiQ (UPF0313 family)